MKPAAFDYVRPAQRRDALAIFADAGSEAVPLTGGQSLVPLMNLRRVRPTLVVDLNHLDELGFIRADDDALVIGALTRQRLVERSDVVRSLCPVLVEARRHVGTPQTRNRGTIGGSICHVDPCAEIPVVLVACDATITLAGGRGERRVAARDLTAERIWSLAHPTEGGPE